MGRKKLEEKAVKSTVRGRKTKAAKALESELDEMKKVNGPEEMDDLKDLDEDEDDLKDLDEDGLDEDDFEDEDEMPEAKPKRRYIRRIDSQDLNPPQTVPVNPDVVTLTSDPEMYFLPMPQDEVYLINPYACGVSSWLPKAKLHRQNCAFFSIELVLEGEGQLEVNECTYDLKPHDVFLLHFNEEHTYQNVGQGRWKKVWISFRHSLLTPGLCQLGLDTISKITLPDEEFEKIRRLFFDVLDEVKGRSMDFRIDASAICYRIFHLLSRRAHVLSSQRANVIPAPIRAVINYAEKNLRKPISMEDLAKVAGCCRVHLTRLFKKHMGIHTRDWLIQLRMRNACMMLKTTNLPIHTVAEEVGFDDPYHFSTAFRRTVGMPPSKYRKMARKANMTDDL